MATDCFMAGKLDGEQMVKNHPDGGKIAILDFPENQSCIDRVQGFLAGLGASRNKFEIVAQQDGAAALDKSLPIAQDIIQAHPDLVAFFAINDPSAMGAIAAIQATHRSGIEVYSVDGSPDGKAAIVEGTMTADAAQVPIKEAEVAFNQGFGVPSDGQDRPRKQQNSRSRCELLHEPVGQQHREGDLSALIPHHKRDGSKGCREVAVRSWKGSVTGRFRQIKTKLRKRCRRRAIERRRKRHERKAPRNAEHKEELRRNSRAFGGKRRSASRARCMRCSAKTAPESQHLINILVGSSSRTAAAS